jgi:hypothetical protein
VTRSLVWRASIALTAEFKLSSGVVRRLNRLEQRPATRNLARRALRRLGFPVSE